MILISILVYEYSAYYQLTCKYIYNISIFISPLYRISYICRYPTEALLRKSVHTALIYGGQGFTMV